MRNFGVVSGTNQDYFSRASALSDEIAKLRVDLSAAEHSRDALKRELANEDPQLPSDPGAANANPSETTLRLRLRSGNSTTCYAASPMNTLMWSPPAVRSRNWNANDRPN